MRAKAIPCGTARIPVVTPARRSPRKAVAQLAATAVVAAFAEMIRGDVLSEPASTSRLWRCAGRGQPVGLSRRLERAKQPIGSSGPVGRNARGGARDLEPTPV